MMNLHQVHLGLAGGIVWGGCMLATTWISLGTGYATDFLNAMAGIYPGYSITFFGSILGLIYGFLDAFIGLYLVAWLYNRFGKTTQSP